MNIYEEIDQYFHDNIELGRYQHFKQSYFPILKDYFDNKVREILKEKENENNK